MKHVLELDIDPQPNDTSCGPTCLAAVYRYWGHPRRLSDLVREIGEMTSGGTLLVHLGCHALRSGFDATIVTYNLQLFDPTWFRSPDDSVTGHEISENLERQLESKQDLPGIDLERLREATNAFQSFLKLGGSVKMESLKPTLIADLLKQGYPILCGLSATYLYREARERYVPRVPDAPSEIRTGIPDSVAGLPVGHFVVIHGYNAETGEVNVADPLHPNPAWPTNKYRVSLNRVFASMLLGVLTHDANLLVIVPRDNSMVLDD